MIGAPLTTTNILLGVMATVSVLQALLFLAIGIGCYRLYRQVMRTLREIEVRQIAPLAARAHALMGTVDGILGDVRDVTAMVTRRTERVDAAIDDTMQRVDETAWRVRTSLTWRVHRLAAFLHGARRVVDTLFNGRRASDEAAAT